MISTSNQLTANKVLRPYDGLEDFDGVFDGLEFRIRGRLDWHSTDDLIFRIEDYAKPVVQIRIDDSSSNWEKSLKSALGAVRLKANQVEIFITLRTSGIKRVREVLRMPLQNMLKSTGEIILDLPLDSDPKLLPDQTSTLEIYLVLGQNGINAFPLPYLKGTWLAQRFVLLRGEPKGSFDFDWLPLDEDERTGRNLHKNSIHLIENLYPLHEGDSFSDCTRAYLDPEHKLRIENMENTAQAKFLQASLVSEVITSSIEFSLSKLRRDGGSFPLWAEIENQGIFGNIIKVLASKGSSMTGRIDPEALYQRFADNLDYVREAVEDFFKLRNLSTALEADEEGVL